MKLALIVAVVTTAAVLNLAHAQSADEVSMRSEIDRLESENQSLLEKLKAEKQSRLAIQRKLLERIHEDAYGKPKGMMPARTTDDEIKELKDLVVEVAPSMKHDIFIARILKQTNALEGVSVAEAERLLGPQNHYGSRKNPLPYSWMFDNGKNQIYYSINATLKDGNLVDWHFITH